MHKRALTAVESQNFRARRGLGDNHFPHFREKLSEIRRGYDPVVKLVMAGQTTRFWLSGL